MAWKRTLLVVAASSCLTLAVVAGTLWAYPTAMKSSAIEVRSIDDLRPYAIPGAGEFLFRNYRIAKTYSDADDRLVPPASWEPRPINNNLDDLLPDPWPAAYIEVYKQRFNPSSFFTNAVMLCNYAATHPESRMSVKPFLDALMDRLLMFSSAEGDALFVRYDFPFQAPAKRMLERGWVSGIGNGFALRGLMHIYNCTKDQRALELADKYANAFKIINTGTKQGPWFSYVDGFGFLWFDEYPYGEGSPSYVLNGQIYTIIGLLSYYRNRPERWVLRMVQGGITTVREYAHLYRRAGKVNRYALSDWKKVDYAPSRTPKQQLQLYQISGDPYFKAMAEAFERDMGKAD
ncbi:D-glucuronyl C5-epimerase family protein [Microvirga solisilvae]|uniref:D-glucuronyl C5-epimerase family protein n=1 Tax=Microvirga solisilvae TaxID=2919498 RepID=UPI001FAFB93E|nr:D-glucuronyl C5-epimerase family protein [Microvirga solisilvae]